MEVSNQVAVIIDYRETNPLLLRALDDHPTFNPKTGYLTTGDYQIGNFLLVERKTCQDFSMSIVQGRLFRQATRLSQEVQKHKLFESVIIIEGLEDEFHKINISREAILGAITSLQIKFHLPVFRTKTPIESVKAMDILHRQIMLDNQSKRSFPVRWGKISRKNRKRNQIYLLQGLPTIGPARAVDLLEHFGSVGKVFTASVDELSEVPGIGKITAINIRKILEP